jgi:Uma2 family endonuclease
MTEATKIVKLTVEEYLEMEKLQDIRHEFIDGHIFAMMGATMAHNKITGNICASLHAQVRGTGCSVFLSAMRVQLEGRFY